MLRLPPYRPHPRLSLRTLLAIGALTLTTSNAGFAPPLASADVFEAPIAASTDDAEQSAGGSSNTHSTDLELTQESTSPQTIGMRWTAVPIPRFATITAAWVQFVAKEAQSEATSLTISAQADSNPAPFAETALNVSPRPRTVASRSWTPVPWLVGERGPNQRTPDLSAVVQEVVNRPGWASGNALVLIVTGTGHRTATSWDGKAVDAPVLHVEYATVPPPEGPPIARLTLKQIDALTIRADASASTDVDLTPIASYAFDFGDGTPPQTTTAPVAEATHVYVAPGPYTVTLIATDSATNPSAPVSAAIDVDASVSGMVEKRVAVASDDAEESASGSVSTTNNDLELVMDSSLQTVGIRWPGLAIPKYARITAAWVQFGSKEARSEATLLTIAAQAADNAPTFTTAARGISTRARTRAVQTWAPGAWIVNQLAPVQRTPDLGAVIQEVVDLPGWASGNAIVLIVTGTGHRTAWSFDARPLECALLHVEYTLGPPPPDLPPVARLTAAQAASPPLTVVADASASTDSDRTPIASYVFDFGDGSPAVTTAAPTATASHRYPDVGSYTVRAVAFDAGGQASDTASATVLVVPPPDDPPVARLSVALLPSPPLSVLADASASTDTDVTPIDHYAFDFGDGTPLVTVTAPAATTSHTYATANTYTVTMVAYDTGSKASVPATAVLTVQSGIPVSLERRIAASADDAEQSSSGSVNLTSSDLELTQESTSPQTIGMRWTGITVPRGALISRAYIQFVAKEAQSEVTSLTFRGEASDAAAAFASASGNVATRARTIAAQAWVPVPWTAGEVGPNQRTPDLAALIQEIVGRPGWTSGNALAIIVTGTGHRTATSFDGKATDAALLHVDYLTSGVPPPDPPVARLTVTQATTPPLTAIANASGSTGGSAATIASYRFDFGDGSPVVITGAPSSTHTYAGAGPWTVTLVVTDAGGQSSAPVTASFAPGASSVSQLEVYAGYYDTHHPGLTKPKPDPWRGSPNVTFVGKPDPGTSNEWDSSALRLVNNGSTALTGVVVTVHMGSKSFALWGTNSIPAGGTLILAQTGFENFDGSDTSPAGCYGCNSRLCVTSVSSTRPVVHVTVGGSTTDYLDDRQTLNTFGVDAAGCPATGTRNDESQAWQRIFPVATQAQAAIAEGNALAPAALTPPPVHALALAPLSPNPSHGDLSFRFSLPHRSAVRLEVYDLMGRVVSTYMDQELEAGDYRGHLDLSDSHAGMYFFRMWTPERSLERRFALVR